MVSCYLGNLKKIACPFPFEEKGEISLLISPKELRVPFGILYARESAMRRSRRRRRVVGEERSQGRRSNGVETKDRTHLSLWPPIDQWEAAWGAVIGRAGGISTNDTCRREGVGAPARRHRSTGIQSRQPRETLLTSRFSENEGRRGRRSGIQSHHDEGLTDMMRLRKCKILTDELTNENSVLLI